MRPLLTLALAALVAVALSEALEAGDGARLAARTEGPRCVVTKPGEVCCGDLLCRHSNGVCCPGGDTCCPQNAECIPRKPGETQKCRVLPPGPPAQQPNPKSVGAGGATLSVEHVRLQKDWYIVHERHGSPEAALHLNVERPGKVPLDGSVKQAEKPTETVPATERAAAKKKLAMQAVKDALASLNKLKQIDAKILQDDWKKERAVLLKRAEEKARAADEEKERNEAKLLRGWAKTRANMKERGAVQQASGKASAIQVERPGGTAAPRSATSKDLVSQESDSIAWEDEVDARPLLARANRATRPTQRSGEYGGSVQDKPARAANQQQTAQGQTRQQASVRGVGNGAEKKQQQVDKGAKSAKSNAQQGKTRDKAPENDLLKGAEGKVVTVKKLVPQPLQLGSHVAPFGDGYRTPQVEMVGNYCALSGKLRTFKVHSIFAHLPAKCRPASTLTFGTHTDDGEVVRLDLLANGRIEWKDGAEQARWLSLDGVVYPSQESETSKLDLADEWTAFGGAHETPLASREGDLCVLSGMVRLQNRQLNTWTADQEQLSVVPFLCRPRDGKVSFVVNSGVTMHRVDIDEQGRLKWVSGTPLHAWLSLNGIAYFAQSPDALPLFDNWENFGSGFRRASFRKQGNYCMLSGLIKGRGRTRITELPAACRPTSRLVFFVGGDRNSIRVDVFPSGEVKYVGEPFEGVLSLDGVHFTVSEGKQPFERIPHGLIASLQAFNFRERYVRVSTKGQVLVTDIFTTQDKLDATFDVVPPLKPANEEGGYFVSLRPREHTESYLAALGDALMMREFANTDDFKAAATFRVMAGMMGEDEGFLTFEAAHSPGFFLRHRVIDGKREVRVEQQEDSAAFRKECSFKVVGRLDKREGPVSTDPSGVQKAIKETLSKTIVFVEPRQLSVSKQNFAYYGEPYRVPQFALYGELCLLSGALRTSNVRGLIAELPPQCRPPKRLAFDLHGAQDVTVRVDVQASGAVRFAGSDTVDSDWLSLDGLSFMIGLNAEPLNLNNAAWKAHSEEYGSPVYYKYGDLCVVSGMISAKNEQWVSFIATLSKECRPKDGRLVFDVNHGDYTHRVDVELSGQLTWVVGNRQHRYLSLDGIMFVPAVGKKLVLETGSKAFGQGFREPSAYKLGKNLCLLSGLLTSNGNEVVAKVPAECRPHASRLVFSVARQHGSHRVAIEPSGEVKWLLPRRAAVWLSLDGVRYVVTSRELDFERDAKDSAKAKPFSSKAAPPVALSLPSGVKRLDDLYLEPSFVVMGRVCYLSGAAAVDRVNRLYAQLPVNCRPAARSVFNTRVKNGATVRLDVKQDGEVLWVAGATDSDWISFDGVAFPTQSAEAQPLSVAPRWRAMPGYGSASWVREGDVCFLSGVLQLRDSATTFPQQLAQLPMDCRPTDANLLVSANSGETTQVLEITRQGAINIVPGAAKKQDYVSLDGVAFSVVTQSKLRLVDGFQAVGKGYREPTLVKQGSLCLVSGVATSATANEIFALLPETCRPRARLVFHVYHKSRPVRIDVVPDGRMIWMGERKGGEWLPLDGVRFITA